MTGEETAMKSTERTLRSRLEAGDLSALSDPLVTSLLARPPEWWPTAADSCRIELLDVLLPKGVDFQDVVTVTFLSPDDALSLARELLDCLDAPRPDLAAALDVLERHPV